jgi:hypothetical protein
MKLRNAALAAVLLAASLPIGLTADVPASAADKGKPAFNISPLLHEMAKDVTRANPGDAATSSSPLGTAGTATSR